MEHRHLFCKYLGFSADGDIRLLRCMRYKTPSISQSSTDEDLLFKTITQNSTFCIQDIIHLIAKMRNRLLKAGILLPMGSKIVSVSHMKILVNKYSKDKHGLVIGDICPDDRQNYRSVQKIIDPKVLKALSDLIIDSEATIMYLNIFSEVNTAFYDPNLYPLERIYRIFHVMYFLRSWKVWIKRTGNQISIK